MWPELADALQDFWDAKDENGEPVGAVVVADGIGDRVDECLKVADRCGVKVSVAVIDGKFIIRELPETPHERPLGVINGAVTGSVSHVRAVRALTRTVQRPRSGDDALRLGVVSRSVRPPPTFRVRPCLVAGAREHATRQRPRGAPCASGSDVDRLRGRKRSTTSWMSRSST